MGKEYLVEGAKLICINGSQPVELAIPVGHAYKSGGKKKANCTDCVADVNIPCFGNCKKNEETNLCEGFLLLADRWESISTSTAKAETLDGEDAISMDSVLLCKRGGIILPLTSGQGYEKGVDFYTFFERFQKIYRWAAGKNELCHIFGKDPINMNTGNYIYEKEDLVIQGVSPLSFRLFYNTMEEGKGRSLGEGWHHNYDIYVKEETSSLLHICLGDGREIPYRRMLQDVYAPVFGDQGMLKKEETGYRYVAGNGVEYGFDREGRLLLKRDRNGNTDTFQHNQEGLLSKVTGANGGALTYTYNRAKQLIDVEDHSGRKVKLLYRYGKLCQFTNAAGQVYTYEYNENGKMDGVITPRGILGVKNEYDGANRVLKQTTPDGGVVEFRYDDVNKRTYMKEQNGNMVIYESDERCRNIKTIYEDGEEVFEYNDKNQRTLYVDKNGNRTRYRYDEKGNLTGITNALGELTEISYNDKGKLLAIMTQGKELRKNQYDSQGRLIETMDALQRSKKTIYDEKGRLEQIIQADESIQRINYDERGNIQIITDAYGGKNCFEYDSLNRVTKSIDPEGNVVSYQYDEMNRITSVVDQKGNVRKYTYNESSLLVKVEDFDDEVFLFSYNARNKVEKIINKEGKEKIYKYGEMGNITKEILPTGAVTTYLHDKNNRLKNIEVRKKDCEDISAVNTYTYDSAGNLTHALSGDGTKILMETYYTYDALNRIISYTNPVGGRTIYNYNALGQMNSIVDPMGNKRSFIYNDAGELVEETDIRGNTIYYTYNLLGQIETVRDEEVTDDEV